MMDDANDELPIQLLLANGLDECDDAVARIQALKTERDRQYDENVHRIAEQARVEAERDAARDAALEAELAFENVDAQVRDGGEFTERSWEQLSAAIRALKGKSHE